MNPLWRPVHAGFTYRVEKHYLGDFVGEVEYADNDLARIRVTDPMRPRPRVENRCCFPECVREDFHSGDHEFVSVRKGALLEIQWRSAKWVLVAMPKQVSGLGQLAHGLNLIPVNNFNRATSPARKARRQA